MKVAILGRYPPPVDGQTIATQRLADLLRSAFDVRTLDTQPRRLKSRSQEGVTPGRLLHFAKLRFELGREVSACALDLALWPSISPDLAGHLRDRWVILPAISDVRRIVAVVHRGNFDELFTTAGIRHSAAKVVRRISKFVFLTQELSERSAPWIPASRRSVIPNTIDERVMFAKTELDEKRKAREDRHSIHLVFVGNMIGSKGYLDALEAVARLRDRGVPIRARFVGAWLNNSDEVHFQNRVRELRLHHIIQHAGPVHDRGAIKHIYYNADLLVLPTYYANEAQPLVIIEALNAGIPVIATRHAGIPEMISDQEEGFFVAKRDPEGIASCVIDAASEDRWQRLSQAARLRFESEYAPKIVRSRWVDLVNDVVDQDI